MKKIMLKVSIIPALLIAGFIALQSFQAKEPLSNQFDDPEWFTYPTNGSDETDASQYTYAPSFDPEASGCEGGSIMCAVKAVRDQGSGEPILHLNTAGTQVEVGGTVDDILRRQ